MMVILRLASIEFVEAFREEPTSYISRLLRVSYEVQNELLNIYFGPFLVRCHLFKRKTAKENSSMEYSYLYSIFRGFVLVSE